MCMAISERCKRVLTFKNLSQFLLKFWQIYPFIYQILHFIRSHSYTNPTGDVHPTWIAKSASWWPMLGTNPCRVFRTEYTPPPRSFEALKVLPSMKNLPPTKWIFMWYAIRGWRKWISIEKKILPHLGTCMVLADLCRTHKLKVVSSSPATANVLWTWANHFTLLALSTWAHRVLV